MLLGHKLDAPAQSPGIGDIRSQRLSNELEVFLAPRRELCQGEIVHFEKSGGDRLAALEHRRNSQLDHAFVPTGRRLGRLRSDPVTVVAVGLVKT